MIFESLGKEGRHGTIYNLNFQRQSVKRKDWWCYGRTDFEFADLLKYWSKEYWAVEVRDEYLQELKDRGFYDKDVVLDKNKPLIFLVTCGYQELNGRFVVIGILNI